MFCGDLANGQFRIALVISSGPTRAPIITGLTVCEYFTLLGTKCGTTQAAYCMKPTLGSYGRYIQFVVQPCKRMFTSFCPLSRQNSPLDFIEISPYQKWLFPDEVSHHFKTTKLVVLDPRPPNPMLNWTSTLEVENEVKNIWSSLGERQTHDGKFL